MVRVPVRLLKNVETIIFELQHGGLDPVNAAVKLRGETLTQRRHPISEKITHHEALQSIPHEVLINVGADRYVLRNVIARIVRDAASNRVLLRKLNLALAPCVTCSM
jgi:hypothetical protein